MYHGKYEAPKGGAKRVLRSNQPIAPVKGDLEELDAQLAALNSAPEEPKAEAAVAVAEPVAEPVPKAAPQPLEETEKTPKKPSKRKKVSLDPKEQENPAIARLLAKKKRKSRLNTMIFYGVYFLMISAVLLVISGILNGLTDWLVNFEASQPNVKCQEVFDQLFADPDWENIYALAGSENTEFESAANYARYMEEKVGEDKLTYLETSAGLSGDHKYIVKHGEEKVAVFTLTAPAHTETEIAKWELGTLEVFMDRRESATVTVAPGHTVYINGKPLGDDHIIRSTATLAENYLPEGVHGYASNTYYIDGLLSEPQITVQDRVGMAYELTYDADRDLYSEEFTLNSTQISDSEKDRVIETAKVLARFRIEKADEATLARYFDANSEYYKSTVKQDTWMQNFRSYSFTEPEVSNYCRYSDDLFSAYITVTLKVTRNNGTVKEWPITNTFFFTNLNGRWMVTDATNIQVQQPVDTVRLVYMEGGKELSREMADANADQLQPPAVTAPEGKVFAGWFRETVDENGDTTLSLVFKPDEATGIVYLAEGTELEPMVLHARYEKAGD